MVNLIDPKQINKNTNFWESLVHALAGVKDLIKRERNFRLHGLLGLIPVILGFLLKISLFEWLWIVLVIFLVLLAESVNTMFENLCDLLVGKKYNSTVKVIKDIGAGGVLIMSSASVICYLIIFLPKLIALVS